MHRFVFATYRGALTVLMLLTLVLGTEAALPVVAVRCKVQSQPVLTADDRGREAASGEPVGTGHSRVREQS